ncbi:MAG: DivIVA domain-containing protein [Lactobacillus sp.]|nr:DivIVA domain-containing protein [Lactobacillus sp.]MDN6052410.1 DivIVA domain-containing protein [Lactobacillus sp.]
MANKKHAIITPMAIHDKHFKRTSDGYNANQVDAFLDELIDDYSDTLDQLIDLKNENYGLKQEIARLKTQSQTRRVVPESISDSAQTVVAEKAEVTNMVADAQVDFDQLKQDMAKLDAENTAFRTKMAKILADESVKVINNHQTRHQATVDKTSVSSVDSVEDSVVANPIQTDSTETQQPELHQRRSKRSAMTIVFHDHSSKK